MKILHEKISQAKDLIHNHNLESAIKTLKECILIDSNFYLAYFELSKIYILNNNETLAINLLKEAIVKHPSSEHFYLLLAEIYLHNLKTYLYSAIDLYETLIQNNHKKSLTYFRLSYLYFITMNLDKSNQYLTLAYESNRENNKAINILLQYEIISASLFNFNYSKHNHFYENYFNKLESFDELKISFNHKYTSWNKIENKKIRLGFISGDLKNHPVCFFLKSLVSNIDTNKYELVAFPTITFEDDYTLDIKKYFQEWIPLSTSKIKESASTIHNTGIDILFDLSGHTTNNGLLFLKYKPAPIQVSWLGYFASTGIPEIDYFLTTSACVKEEEHQYFTEKVLNLPETYLSYDFSNIKIKQDIMPYDKNKYITFGFFQNLSKSCDKDIELWEKLLQKIPNSKLIIKSSEISNPQTKEIFLQKLKNIPLNKLELRGQTNLDEHLRQHNDVDIMLDAYNVSGCTTTCQSLYMGVPIVTFKGFSMLTRHGEQFLTLLNLKDFIASDINDFISICEKQCSSIDRLRTIKNNLRENVLNSSMGNGLIFTQQFENILDKIINH